MESGDDEIVISGISGRFPNSHNVSELAHKLYNKIDCCDDDERRFRHRPNIPKRHGKIHDLKKFDAFFFGMNQKVANVTDPQTRCLMEHAYEAVLDAGINPVDIKGSNTGVFTSILLMESSDAIIRTGNCDPYTIVGLNRGMLSNRISYAMDLHGPSFTIDSACSSTMMAIYCAYTAIQNGECDAAIVGGSNLTLSPIASLCFARLGVLAPDGFCRPFDKNASGYTRSEAITAFFIQRKKLAKRCYATIVHTKVNCDGYKPEGITYPASQIQQRLFDQFYQELNLNPATVNYVEAHGTGTIVGDREECQAIYKTFCKDRKEPLLIGSVKSSIGHTEPVSGLCSITKCIFALETGIISPNINFEEINEDIISLKEGYLKVVTESTILPGPLVACSSFGFGGGNGHILLKQNPKQKVNFGIPSDDLPRLVCWSGRTEESCNVVLDEVCKHPLDAEFVGLLQNSQTKSIQANMYRGYGVFSQQDQGDAVCTGREVERSKGIRAPLVWVYSGMGSQWTQMGKSLMALPIFKKSIESSHRILEKKGLNLIEIITSDNKNTFDNILHSFVGIAAIQIGLTNILREMNIEPDYIIGHSVGELGCAYADRCFTAEEMILSAYSRGMASLETKVVHGSMAAIGLGYEQIRPMLPAGIEAACHNGPDSCTISGPSELVAKFVKELTDKDIFAREVPCSNIPYHSKYISEMGPKLLARLQEVIKTPKQRSSKWLSTSVPKCDWEKPESNFCSAEYHTNNLLSSVLFEETMKLLPENVVTIEIAPHGLLQAILRKGMTSANHISLTQRNNANSINVLLSGLGKIYNQGFDLPVEKLYPAVEFPVSAGTPMISPLIKWDHTNEYFVSDTDNTDNGVEQHFNILLSKVDYKFIEGHKIDSRILFPATGYLFIAWSAFCQMQDISYKDTPVEISDIKFVRATTLQKDTTVLLTVVVHRGTGKFEITESNSTVVTGNINHLEKLNQCSPPDFPENESVILKNSDFYKELKIRGYHYEGEFKSVLEARSDASRAKISWKDNFVSFMDCMLQIGIIGIDSRSLMVPTALENIQIDPKLFLESLQKTDDTEFMEVSSCKVLQILQTKGIRMQGLKANSIIRRKPPGEPVLESYQFIPFLLPQNLNLSNALRVFVQLGLEIIPSLKFKVIEVGDRTYQPIIGFVQNALDDLPMISAELTLLSNEPELEIPGVTIESETILADHTDCLFIIGCNLATDLSKLEAAARSCKDRAIIITTESFNFGSEQLALSSNFEIVSVIPVDGYSLVMIQFIKKRVETTVTYMKISTNDKEFSWLDEAKKALKKGKLCLIAQREPLNGIIGFVNCLRREPECKVDCIFIDDECAPKFDPELPFYRQQIDRGLPINVYRHGVWGSYRHILLNNRNDPQPQTDHCFVNTAKLGDLSSLTWFAGPLDTNDQSLIQVWYSSINFKDVMTATKKIDLNFMYDRIHESCLIGIEYSGVTKGGKRVMGIVQSGGMATHVKPDILTWEVPSHWTLAEAATVPVVYTTVYAAFFLKTQIERGKKILIHAGTGGIGLSAIRVALHYGLEVFTTVSTDDKKRYLLDLFPELKSSHIGNSRDTSFYEMIMIQTKGLGVDYVLNSLADDKLTASLKCLGEEGHFIEIGKYDILNDSKIGLGHFKKNITFHVVMLDKQIKDEDLIASQYLHQKIKDDIETGIIIPLQSTVFEANEIEKAFRYLASAKHMGKVLIKVREDDFKKESMPIVKYSMVYFKPNLSYIIPGGLGGFGLELADWMILRGCRKIILSSSKGIRKPYQQYRINLWRTYGVQVTVSTDDIKTPEGCLNLIKCGMTLGSVGGIFNLAVVLRDNIFENQDPEKFSESMSVKAYATKYLDEISRKLCPQLEHFVVFSSVSCGRGNAGQSNYGMANSVMERIVEARVAAGYPGKAIQWGAVGEVGLVAQMAEDKIDMEIGGTLQQRISSCLQVLDSLLTCPDPVVGSMVVAEKKVRAGTGIKDTVLHIIGIKDTKSIPMDQKLTEVGMDSLMAVEIKQTLEREYELILSPQDLRNLTLRSLTDLSNKKTVAEQNTSVGLKPSTLALLFRHLGDEDGSNELIVQLNKTHHTENFTIILPGVEGVAGKVWHDLSSKLNLSTSILQYKNVIGLNDFNKISDMLVKEHYGQFVTSNGTFMIIAYSYGSILSLYIVRKLEEIGLTGKLVIIDGSPLYLQKSWTDTLNHNPGNELQKQLLIGSSIMSALAPNISQLNLLKCESLKQIIECIVSETQINSPYTVSYATEMINNLYNSLSMLENADFGSFTKIKSDILLIKASEQISINAEDDYSLSKFTTGVVDIKVLDGDHSTILNDDALVEILNEHM